MAGKPTPGPKVTATHFSGDRPRKSAFHAVRHWVSKMREDLYAQIMSEIHIATRDGQKAFYNQAEINPAIADGRIPPDALYWQAGMAEWSPVSELGVRAPAVPAMPPLPSYTFYKDPSFLTSFLVFLIYTQAAAALISLLSDFAQLALLGSSSLTATSGAANDARQQMIGIIYLLVYITTAIVFLTWVNRANKNCRGFASGMEFTSGWSVGWYFVPIMCLFKPFQVMSEIWRVSHDPGNWKAMHPPALMRWWWGLWLLSCFVGQISFRMTMSAKTLDALQTSTVISIFSSGMDIPLCIVAAMMVGKIFQAQQRLVTGR